MNHHIILKDGGNITGVMCIEREIESCVILQTSIDEVDKLLVIANSLGVTVTQIIIPPELVEVLELKGWKKTDYIVMYHE